MKLIEAHKKYIVSIGETVLRSLISAFGCASGMLLVMYTPFLYDSWVGHLVEGLSVIGL